MEKKMKNFWFTDPFLKPLLPLAGACFVKGLGSNFMANKVFMGPNIFPVGPQIFPGAPPQIALKCPMMFQILEKIFEE